VAATGASVLEADVEQLNLEEMTVRMRGHEAWCGRQVPVAATAGVSTASVSRDDVAAVTAYVLGHAVTTGRTIELTSGDIPIAEALA
jgi:uncharacterized protein YbjT (DUF2867 family)